MLQEKEKGDNQFPASPKSALRLKNDEKIVVTKYEEKKLAQTISHCPNQQIPLCLDNDRTSLCNSDQENQSLEPKKEADAHRPRNLSRLDHIYKRKHSPIQQRLKDLKTTERNRRIDKKINDLRICNKPDVASPVQQKNTS